MLTLPFFGHINRRDFFFFLPKVILKGKFEGKRDPRKPVVRWKDGISDLLGINISDASCRAQDYSSWNNFVMATTDLHRVA